MLVLPRNKRRNGKSETSIMQKNAHFVFRELLRAKNLLFDKSCRGTNERGYNYKLIMRFKLCQNF